MITRYMLLSLACMSSIMYPMVRIARPLATMSPIQLSAMQTSIIPSLCQSQRLFSQSSSSSNPTPNLHHKLAELQEQQKYAVRQIADLYDKVFGEINPIVQEFKNEHDIRNSHLTNLGVEINKIKKELNISDERTTTDTTSDSRETLFNALIREEFHTRKSQELRERAKMIARNQARFSKQNCCG